MAVIFIDKNISNFADLLDEFSQSHLVYILDSSNNAFEQIAKTLESQKNLGSIHILSHGEPGILKFSSGFISSNNISDSQNYLVSIGNALGPGGDIHLYGCNVGQGTVGQEFLQLISSKSNSSIAASNNMTGPGILNADWDLEIVSGGTVNSASLVPSVFSGTLGTPSISDLDDPIGYTENAALAALDTNITVTGGISSGDKYEGGWIEFSLTGGASTDFLRFTDDGTASTVNGQVSIVNSVLYVGNGTGAAILGNVDSIKDGLAGNALRVNISNKFQNGDFETNDTSANTFGNWQITDTDDGPIIFGTTTIGGLNTPTDTTFPTPTGSRADNDPQSAASDQILPLSDVGTTYVGVVNDDGGGEYSVKLTSSTVRIDSAGLRADGSTRLSGYDIIRGPALYSDNTVYLRSGDQVSFDWKADGGADAYDVYGYIVNVDDNSFITILDETGAYYGYGDARNNTSWSTETVTVNTPGSYKFVFVAGTYDYTGGYYAGAQLFVDNVTVTENIVPPTISDTMVQEIARRVKYESTSEDPPASKDLTVKVTSINGSNGNEQLGTASSTINFTKTNDAPVITSATTSSVDENLDASTVVYTATATDVDSSDTLTYAVSGADSGLITIDANNGQVTFNSSADFETKSSYSFNVSVTDDGTGTLSDTEAITVSINDINEAPVITSVATSSVNENLDASSVVYTATATDVDSSDTLTYSVSGTDAGLVAIDANNGQVTLNSSANFEAKSNYNFNVVATDNGTGTLSGTKAITVNINDINDAPVVTSITTPSVNENLDASTVVYTVNATDDDSDTLTYSLSGTDAALVSIDTDDGEVRLNTSADFETKSSYNFNVKVTDDGAGALSVTEAVSLSVNDINDPPSILSGSTGSIDENADITTVAYDATASDPDSGQTVTFSVTGTDASLVEVDSDDGEIRLKAAANFETKNAYSFNVVATDNGASSASVSKAITINVNDKNDTPVAIDDLAITTMDVSKNNIVVLDDDIDEDGNTLSLQSVTYSGSGTVTDDGSTINYTPPVGASSLTETITYVISDGNGGTDSGVLTVKVVTPLIQGPSNLAGSSTSETSINENLTVVTTLTANVAVIWSINSGLDGDKFNIDAGGNLTFVSGPNFELPTDSDSNNTYEVEIKAAETTVGYSSTQILTVTINNVNEAAPVIDTTNLTGNLNENSDITSVIYTVLASDADVSDVLTYSVSGGADSGLVTIDSDDGEIRLNALANFETKTSYSFDVTVTDPDNSNDTASITISINDVNEAPVITSAATSSVNENSDASTVIYTATATDADPSNSLSYSVSGTDSGLVTIDSDDGEVRLNASADFETQSSYSFNVVATDDGTGTLSGVQTITVSVNDINEAPDITSAVTATIDENLDASDVIYTVTAIDVDSSDTLSYSLSGTDAGLVTIDSDDGEVRLNSSADFETKPSYSFNVIVTDNGVGTLSDTEVIILNINDINEAPVITSAATSSVNENLDASTVVYTATATDVDTSDVLTYSVSGLDSTLVIIDADDGEVRLLNSANFEAKSNYSFDIIATDNGTGLLSKNQGITVSINDVNDLPTVKSPPALWQVIEERSTTKTIVTSEIFYDDDNDSLGLTVRLAGGATLPGWITFAQETNVIEVQPTRADLSGAILEILADDGNGGTVNTELEIEVAPINHPVSGNVIIEGDVNIGYTVTAIPNLTDLEGGANFVNYQWYRDETIINGANGSKYNITSTDAGSALKVKVSFTDNLGFQEMIWSSPTTVISYPVKTLTSSSEEDREVFKDAFSQIVIKGTPNDDIVVATGGDSAVDGGAGSDVIIGGTGDNPLSGNTQNDFLIGDLLLSAYFLGNDTLEGGPGDDFIEGGNGVDTFVFSPKDGNDIIAKFNLDINNLLNSSPVSADFVVGKDKVDLSAFGYQTFAEVNDKIGANSDGFARFADEGCSIVFYGVSPDQLSAVDFLLI